MSPKGLIIGAVVCLFLQTARENVDAYRDRREIYKGLAITKIDTTVTKLTDKQKKDLEAMNEFKEESTHEAKIKKMKKSLESVTGSYGEFYEYQSQRSFKAEINYLYYGCWDILIFMFLGMAFFKNGVLLGQASSKVYWVMFITGLGVGLTISYLRLLPIIEYKFNYFDYAKNTSFEFYGISRAFRAIGIFGLIMLLYKSGWFKWLFALMRPVGQMAFTNYLMQSLLVGLFFYGVGFGMFGKLERYEMYYVVAAVWVLQITWSHLWLRFFRFGPLEWLWRSLTYWKKQPFRKSGSAAMPPE